MAELIGAGAIDPAFVVRKVEAARAMLAYMAIRFDDKKSVAFRARVAEAGIGELRRLAEENRDHQAGRMAVALLDEAEGR